MTTETQAPTEINVPADAKLDMNMRTQFMIGIPVGLKLKLEAVAKEREISVATIVRNAIAGAVGYTLAPTTERTKKYASEAERKEAQKAKNKERRDLLKVLMQRYKAELAGGGAEGVEDEDEDEDEDEA